MFSSSVEGWPVYWVERSAGSATHLRQPLAIGTLLKRSKENALSTGMEQGKRAFGIIGRMAGMIGGPEDTRGARLITKIKHDESITL